MSSAYVLCWIFLQTFQTYFCIQANSVDPDQTAPFDQTAPKGAVWSGSTLFAKMTFKITSRWQSRRKLLWLAALGLKWPQNQSASMNLTFKALSKIAADDIVIFYYYYFSKKIRLSIRNVKSYFLWKMKTIKKSKYHPLQLWLVFQGLMECH